MHLRFAASALAILLATALPAGAADVYAPYDPNPAEPAPAAYDYGDTDFVFELGLGGAYQPDYLGSDDYEGSLYPIFSVEYLNLPGLGSFGGRDGRGFSIGPSFKYIGERDGGDLFGLDKVDDTYEIGLKASYTWDYAEVYGAVRYAFGGAEGVTGDIGANLIVRPTDRIELKAGPTASLASSDYMGDYFSVSPEEFLRSGGRFDVYEADGGFQSVGVKASARYEVITDWFVTADASWERLVGDAGDSPVVTKAGDDDQFYFGLGLSKRFSLDLF